jgi:putative dehydrogenase
MGAALAGGLRRRGLPVVTCLAGRSQGTAAAAAAAGVEALASLEEVVAQADVVLSVVPPGEARTVAAAIAAAAGSTGSRPVVVDCNSVSPATIEAIAATIADAGLPFADVAIRGGADRLETLARAYASGPAADVAGAVLGLVLPVEQLGPEAGRASAMKMALAGLAKGIAALVLESAAVANRDGLLDPFLADAERFYPGALAALERVAPGYPAAAARRSVELGEAVAHAEWLCADATIARAVAAHLERVATAALSGPADARELILAFSSLGEDLVVTAAAEGRST